MFHSVISYGLFKTIMTSTAFIMEPDKNKESEEIIKSFSNWKHNAIHLTFPNGNRLSTVWGVGTYSDNHNEGWDIDSYRKFRQSDTVEIMILNAPEKLIKKIQKKYDFVDDSVKGYLTMTEWLDIIKMLSK